MTSAEFAAKIKAKYPQYSGMDDASLVSKIVAKYPNYAAQISDAPVAAPKSGPPGPMGKYGGVPGNQFDLSQSPLEAAAGAFSDWNSAGNRTMAGEDFQPQNMSQTIGKGMADTLIGAGKGVIGTATNLADMIPGVNVSPDLKAATAPQNVPQQIGQFGERVGEIALPAGALGAAAKARFGTGLVGTGLDALAQAGVVGSADVVHGDRAAAPTDMAIAAAFPIVGKGIDALLSKGSSTAIDSFLGRSKGEVKKGIAKLSPSQVMDNEGIVPSRLGQLRDAVQTRIDVLKDKIKVAVDVASQPYQNGKTGIQILPQVTKQLNDEAKLFTGSEDRKTILNAITEITDQVDQLSGGTGALSPNGVNDLRQFVGDLMERSPNPAIKAAYGRVYGTIAQGLEANVPGGVRALLMRERELIGLRNSVADKIASPSTVGLGDMVRAGGGALVGHTLGGPVGAAVLGGASVGSTAYKYAPVRFATARIMGAMGTAADMLGNAIGPSVSAFRSTAAVQADQPAPPVAGQPPVVTPPPQRQINVSPSVAKWQPNIDSAAQQANVDPALLAAMVQAESDGNPAAKSNRGAMGLTQMTPVALKELGLTKDDIQSPDQQLLAGARYLRLMLDHFNGNATLALAAYNAGESVVRKHQGVPPYKETQDYVARIARIAGPAMLGR